VSDIFREVEEDVRRERLEKWWKAYGDYVIAGVSVLIIAVAAYIFWTRYEEGQRAKAGTAFVAAQQIVDPARAATAFGKIAATAPSGYARLARLEQADALSATGNRGKALDIYKSVASGSGPIADAARIRAAWGMADTAPRAQLVQWLAPLTSTNTAWSQMGREILAYVDFHTGKTADALKEYQSLSHDMQAPDGVRQRAGAMTAFLSNGGGRDFGTVPPPPAPAAPAASGNSAP
jgi:hypothetical protein